MNQKISVEQVFPIFLGLLLIAAIVIVSQQIAGPPTIDLSVSRNVSTTAEVFESGAAADLYAARWQAMGEFYKKEGLLRYPVGDI